MGQEEDESPSGEQWNVLFDLLEELPAVPLSRNDPCLCGSGKKYKKCCLEKERTVSSSPELQLESFEITVDALTPEESKEIFAPLSEEDQALIEALYRNFHEHPETIDSEDCHYFRQLNALRVKYPDNPMILNHITNGYDLLGQQDKVDALIAETYEKFPDYLFAQTAQANIYLREGFPEKALETLKGAYTLKALYPYRTVFHISEVEAFETVMIKYFYITENLKQAEIHLQLLENIFDEEDDVLQNARQMVRKLKTVHKFKVGLARLFRLGRKEGISGKIEE